MNDLTDEVRRWEAEGLRLAADTVLELRGRGVDATQIQSVLRSVFPRQTLIEVYREVSRAT